MSSKMRVAMMTYSLRPRGGVVHAVSLAESLKAESVDVKLFSLCRDDGSQPKEFFRRTDVPFEIFEFKWHENIKERLDSMTRTLIDNLPMDFDVYHAQDCVCDRALQSLKTEGALGASVVRTVHHVEGFRDEYLNNCEQAALRSDTAKITVSRYWQNELKAKYGIGSTVIHNGIDASRFEQAEQSREPFILFVGGMERRKGLDIAIRTLGELRARGSDLRMIAIARPGFQGAETRATYEQLIGECRLEGKVEIREQVSDDEMVRLYAKACLFLLPTRMEGWGLSIMEAMASGCPVVTTPVGGVLELVQDGKNGLLAAVDDVDAMTSAVERILKDAALRESIVESGRRTVRGYTWKSAAVKTMEFYQKLLKI